MCNMKHDELELIFIYDRVFYIEHIGKNEPVSFKTISISIQITHRSNGGNA